jgi:hypothetical protein
MSAAPSRFSSANVHGLDLVEYQLQQTEYLISITQTLAVSNLLPAPRGLTCEKGKPMWSRKCRAASALTSNALLLFSTTRFELVVAFFFCLQSFFAAILTILIFRFSVFLMKFDYA